MKLAVLGGGHWGKNLIREFNNCNVLKYICDTNKSVLDSYNEMYPKILITDNYQSILDDKEVKKIKDDFLKKYKGNLITLSTLDKKSISNIKSKITKYVSYKI